MVVSKFACRQGSVTSIRDKRSRASEGKYSGKVKGTLTISGQQIDVVRVSVGICWIIVKGEISCEQGVKVNTARPDIYRGIDERTFRYDEFWCSVAWATAACLHKIVRSMFESVCEPEVGNDDIAVSIQQKILQL